MRVTATGRRWGRWLAAALPLLFALNLAGSAHGRQRGIVNMAVTATPVPLDPTDRARNRVGALTWLGGWVLHGRDSRFGGFSSLAVDGDSFLSVSDTGSYVRFHFARGQVTESSIGDLPAFPNEGRAKGDRDAESMTRDVAGRAWIGFEDSNQIWRYDAGLTHAEGHAAPAAMRRWDQNGGAESMVRLADGRFLVVAETTVGKAPDSRVLLLFGGDPLTTTAPPIVAAYRPPAGGFDPSDATLLPDGRVALLNRHVSLMDGFVSALTVIDPAEIRPGAVLVGREIARLAPPLTVDNMEGLAAVRANGRTVLWMIADDNFMPFERTLLLSFALDEPPMRKGPATPR